MMICVYDIPNDILTASVGTGFYWDFIDFENIQEVTEYAIESERIRFKYLEKIYTIKEDLDFDYLPDIEELHNYLSVFYDLKLIKSKIEEVLKGENVAKSINDNMDYLIYLIPEIKYIVGFEHKHPHHHLDVWQHTLEVLKNLNSRDLELNMAAILHDIGKPFSYQDEEVRHYHGHPEMSYEMTKQILERLGYDENFIRSVSYLVRTHDTVIEPNNLDNTLEMVQKRLQLQYADAKSHHPDKIDKRIRFLDDIKKQLPMLEVKERDI